jgi:hypothetical protein
VPDIHVLFPDAKRRWPGQQHIHARLPTRDARP